MAIPLPIIKVYLPDTSVAHCLQNDIAPGLQLHCVPLQSGSQAEPLLSAPLISIGSEAFKLLVVADSARIIAVFERCFYMQYPSGVICVGIRSLGEGPLQILLDSDDLNFSQTLSVGMLLSLQIQSISCGDHHRQLDNSLLNELPLTLFSGHIPRTLTDPPFKTLITKKRRSAGPMDQAGFGWIAGADEYEIRSRAFDSAVTCMGSVNNQLHKLCIPAITSLIEWLRQALNDQKDPALNSTDPQVPFYVLLGAGAGLTPAGDDLLAGVLLALHYSDRSDCAKALWKLLKPHLNHRTNTISAAHLKLAAKGQCAMPVLQLLDCLFTRRVDVSSTNSTENVTCKHYPADIHTLADSIGASSGWDMLAGMTLVTRAL